MGRNSSSNVGKLWGMLWITRHPLYLQHLKILGQPKAALSKLPRASLNLSEPGKVLYFY
jgi:hypothetical protein